VLALLLAVPVAASRQEKFDYRAAIADPEVLALFAQLIGPMHSSVNDVEIAAFLVRDARGRFTQVEWPPTFERTAQRYHGTIPRGTVAIFHTHPWLWPKPSPHDLDAARRTRLPIFALTRDYIYVVDPDTGESERLVYRTDWSRSAR
jgi:hypothetical protein